MDSVKSEKRILDAVRFCLNHLLCYKQHFLFTFPLNFKILKSVIKIVSFNLCVHGLFWVASHILIGDPLGKNKLVKMTRQVF